MGLNKDEYNDSYSNKKSVHGNDSEFSRNYKSFMKKSAVKIMVTDNNSSKYSHNPASEGSLFPDTHSLR
jgi:hypothetical protein